MAKSFESMELVAVFPNPRVEETYRNPVEQLLPTMTKCTYRKYSWTGDLMELHRICVLTQNLVNQKKYIFTCFRGVTVQLGLVHSYLYFEFLYLFAHVLDFIAFHLTTIQIVITIFLLSTRCCGLY